MYRKKWILKIEALVIFWHWNGNRRSLSVEAQPSIVFNSVTRKQCCRLIANKLFKNPLKHTHTEKKWMTRTLFFITTVKKSFLWQVTKKNQNFFVALFLLSLFCVPPIKTNYWFSKHIKCNYHTLHRFFRPVMSSRHANFLSIVLLQIIAAYFILVNYQHRKPRFIHTITNQRLISGFGLHILFAEQPDRPSFFNAWQ